MPSRGNFDRAQLQTREFELVCFPVFLLCNQLVRPIRIGLSRISVRSTGLAPLILSESSSLFEALANILSK